MTVNFLGLPISIPFFSCLFALAKTPSTQAEHRDKSWMILEKKSLCSTMKDDVNHGFATNALHEVEAI